MKSSLLLKCLLVFVVICSTAYSIQSCKKSQNYSGPYPFYVFGCLYTGTTITFSSDDSNGIFPPYTANFLWEFGDGTSTTYSNPVHVYQQPGIYTVTCIVNNDVSHAASQTIQITRYLMSSYTSQMSGIRSWNGGYNQLALNAQSIIDTPLAVQVIDSGTIAFIGDTLHLISTDTINNNVLIYSDCGRGNLFYYYGMDSIIYIYTLPQGMSTFYTVFHSP